MYLPRFQNEPICDYANVEAAKQAVRALPATFGEYHPAILGGKRVETAKTIVSTTPSHPDLVLGRVASCTREHVDQALAAAQEQPQAPAPAPGPGPAATAEPAHQAPTQVIPETIETFHPTDLDPRTRAAAERLARVLVGDVELYFPEKVAKAQSQGNLYALLRDELERSRANFVERFGEDVEIQHRIFTNTIIQLLCNGDKAKLGSAPWA